MRRLFLLPCFLTLNGLLPAYEGSFSTARLQKEVVSWQQKEHVQFGKKRNQRWYKKKPFRGTRLMQRSGRYRLYDHNILLRSLFAGSIRHHDRGNLAEIFSNAFFVDIGSAILYGDGAPTVRDIAEDDRVGPKLGKIIATDINDRATPGANYVDIYEKNGRKLPFDVKAIDPLLDSPAKWQAVFRLEKGTPLILRSANAGPDLFYDKVELLRHFRSLALTGKNSAILYLFNKFLLFKPAGADRFEKIGEIDYKVGLSHYTDAWLTINWKKRKLKQAAKFDPKLITVERKKKKKNVRQI